MNCDDELFMNFCSWTVLEQFMNCDDEQFIDFCSWTSKFNFVQTVCELFMNYFWVHNKFLNSSWTDDELFMNVYSLDQQCELFRNFWWIVHELFCFHNKFLNSSWTVMVNSSWTLVHELTMQVFYELFMNVHECSWMFMNSSWSHELHFTGGTVSARRPRRREHTNSKNIQAISLKCMWVDTPWGEASEAIYNNNC